MPANNATRSSSTSRPERLDPPEPLVARLGMPPGCYFSIDSDAHATGQLEWQPHPGCDRAAATGVGHRTGDQHLSVAGMRGSRL